MATCAKRARRFNEKHARNTWMATGKNLEHVEEAAKLDAVLVNTEMQQ